ncbi:putative aldoxime dehydratase protein [Neofusicoccum parvum UCRNP2]|uniref:Putative aldoxime dehydratase protein n=1 Tax=Botryosphaeria parva (strain UCR-NP2) TaxID=1287680 RepID=R1EGW2_BOTPV|nr:putative aldoxime dehydratase protein [Neofusicoccum parvum UCRNP2]
MSYWKSPNDYQQWWDGEKVSQFWASLPADAGFWREKLSLASTRAMFETNKNTPNGFAHAGSLVDLTEKTGYWGAYRDRLDDATPQDRLTSPLRAVPPPTPRSARVRSGRVVIDRFPDNMCFVVEGQDHAAMGPGERDHWAENFDLLTKSWVSHVVNAGPEAGMVSARLCHAPQSGRVEGGSGGTAEDQGWAQAFDFNRKVQILYFLDMSYMERIGKSTKTHVDLRRKFMQSYAPTGPMANGDLLLWVELAVLKAQDVEAEYIGCYEGTGFMAYEEHPSFQKEAVGGFWSPWSMITRASQYVFG